MVNHPEWSKSSVIYELNTRQFTPEGTFNAAAKHLTRLKNLGVDIIWLMPIYPIGKQDRKGTLGSYYSIQSYTDINPEFGTLEDFKEFVAQAKTLGLRVIIDWVANHTSRDAKWVTEHPSWYKYDANGKLVAPYDWTDVAQLDTYNHEMWEGMAHAMTYWLNETPIDGFRCDMASLLPVDFWNFIRIELDKVRPVFMLAESEDPYLHRNAFNATYCWELVHLIDGIAQGKNSINDIESYFRKQASLFSKNDYRMAFTSNHDENTWSGSEFERLGLAAKAMAAFTFMIPSIPLIYNGQEAAYSSRLSFFEKDCIEWNVNRDFETLYQKLCQLKQTYRPLWNGPWGGETLVSVDGNGQNVKIERRKEDESVIAFFNFSSSYSTIQVPNTHFVDYLTEALYTPGSKAKLGPWSFIIFVK